MHHCAEQWSRHTHRQGHFARRWEGPEHVMHAGLHPTFQSVIFRQFHAFPKHHRAGAVGVCINICLGQRLTRTVPKTASAARVAPRADHQALSKKSARGCRLCTRQRASTAGHSPTGMAAPAANNRHESPAASRANVMWPPRLPHSMHRSRIASVPTPTQVTHHPLAPAHIILWTSCLLGYTTIYLPMLNPACTCCTPKDAHFGLRGSSKGGTPARAFFQ